MSGILLLLLASTVGAFNVTAAPPLLASSAIGGPFTTAPVTAIPSGGSGSYTFAWAIGDLPAVGSIAITSPSTATTTVTVSLDSPGDFVIGSIICTVTDTGTGETASVEVAVRHRDRDVPI